MAENDTTLNSAETERVIQHGARPVMEIFGPTIQGEGPMIGRRSHFVRFGGCPYRCTWCDSMHAVLPAEVKKNAKWMTPQRIIDTLQALPFASWVTLTGGDPVMWDLTALVANPYFRWQVETEGALWQPWLEQCHMVAVSPKGPSSGMRHKLDTAMLTKYETHLGSERMALKVVVFTVDDFDFARYIHERYSAIPFYISVGTPLEGNADETILEGLRNLADDVLAANWCADVTLLPQMHALIWGHKQGH